MLCNVTGAVHLFNNKAPSVINNVAARGKKQNNYFSDTQVLIMTHKSMCVCGDLFSLWIGDVRVASPHFPMNVKPGHFACQAGFPFSLSLFKD